MDGINEMNMVDKCVKLRYILKAEVRDKFLGKKKKNIKQISAVYFDLERIMGLFLEAGTCV